MLLILVISLLVAWLCALILILGVCRMAAYGDTAPPAAERQWSALHIGPSNRQQIRWSARGASVADLQDRHVGIQARRGHAPAVHGHHAQRR